MRAFHPHIRHPLRSGGVHPDLTTAASEARPPRASRVRNRSRGSRTIWVGCALVVALSAATSLLLRARVPVTLLNGAQLDDDLFLRSAISLTHHRWLGTFDELTLAKGPAYPVFIAFTHVVGLPLKLGEQLTLLLAALALAGSVWYVTRRPVVATAVFVAIALEPASFSAANSRVFRDGWYASLALLLVASFFLAVHAAVTRGSRWWPLPAGAFAGLTGGVFWLCREEGVWILPSLLLLALVPGGLRLLSRRAAGGRNLRSRRLWRRAGGVAAVLAVAGGSGLLVVGGVAVKNQRVYGVALTNDVSTGAIARAYADWANVEAGTARHDVPISAAQRAAVYAVSPAARELQPSLEDPANHWISAGCRRLHICNDYAGGWEIWALREAAASAGHFGSEVEAQRYFASISDQITVACADGRLTCLPRLPTSLQPLQHAHPSQLLDSAARGLRYVTTSGGVTTPPQATAPVPATVRRSFATMVGGVPATHAGADRQLRAFQDSRPVYAGLRALYRALLPALAVLGLLGWAASVITRRHRGQGLGVLSAALAVAVVARLFVLAVFDTTSFPASTSAGYQFPTQLMLLAFGAVGSAQLADVLLDRRRPLPPVPPAVEEPAAG